MHPPTSCIHRSKPWLIPFLFSGSGQRRHQPRRPLHHLFAPTHIPHLSLPHGADQTHAHPNKQDLHPTRTRRRRRCRERTIGGLPFHLTERILRCISPLESVRLATVCRSWAATISERLATPTPHLFALEVLDDKHPRGAIFPVPVGDNEEDSQAPAIPARLPAMGRHAECFELCGASSSGNLSFVNGSLVLLVNPVTGASRSVEISASICQTGPNLCTGTEAFFITEFHRGVSLWWWCAEEWSERKLLLPEGFKIYHAIALSAYSNGALYALEFSGLVYAMDTRLPLPWGLTRLSAPSILEQYSPTGRHSRAVLPEQLHLLCG
ncbi:uncharacterized protein [Triticum aestivum]|uniref:uncharacterized protein n=1 Tax=Triticum aestivum TaxID=4565 RepID=UPI001D03594D|nr:uncharacterized protein LOC123153043 [Triticum aestivum]